MNSANFNCKAVDVTEVIKKSTPGSQGKTKRKSKIKIAKKYHNKSTGLNSEASASIHKICTNHL